MTITDKYRQIRKHLQPGDIIIYRGKGFFHRGIQYFDKSYYSHAGIAFKLGERWFSIDSLKRGVTLSTLSENIVRYEDFCVLRPKCPGSLKKYGIETMLEYVSKNKGYDYWFILRHLIHLKFNKDAKFIGNPVKYVCSELVQHYTFAMDFNTYRKDNLLTPEDLIRQIDDNFTLLFDDKIIKS